jgi:hypothetical protein
MKVGDVDLAAVRAFSSAHRATGSDGPLVWWTTWGENAKRAQGGL